MKCFSTTLAFSATLAAVVCMAYCGCNPPPPAAPTTPVDEHAEHDHGEEGPHHGQIIELGDEEYHAELVHDDATHTITVYLLDGSAEKSVPTAEKEVTINVIADGKPTQFTLAADPQGDDPAGEASRFQSTDEKLCEALDAEDVKGRLNVTIAGKPFVGEVSHGDHDHAHDTK